ncbi:MAG: metallophosphatase, partial [Parvularculaceae bacterium]|nr:metallophosphatase [Parvularculaceae bacterium]
MHRSGIIRPIVAGLVFALAAGFFSAGGAAKAEPVEASAPIVAVGDLHGDYDAYQAILREAKLIDAKGKWTCGKAILVQLG